MHELAVCQALLEQVAEVARANNATRVNRVTVLVGPLSGIEPGLLRSAFSIASQSGIARAAELVIDQEPVRVRCPNCQSESIASPNNLRCSLCGEARTQIVTGDALTLTNIGAEYV